MSDWLTPAKEERIRAQEIYEENFKLCSKFYLKWGDEITQTFKEALDYSMEVVSAGTQAGLHDFQLITPDSDNQTRYEWRMLRDSSSWISLQFFPRDKVVGLLIDFTDHDSESGTHTPYSSFSIDWLRSLILQAIQRSYWYKS